MTALPSFFPAVAAGVAGRAGDKSPQPYSTGFFPAVAAVGGRTCRGCWSGRTGRGQKSPALQYEVPSLRRLLRVGRWRIIRRPC